MAHGELNTALRVERLKLTNDDTLRSATQPEDAKATLMPEGLSQKKAFEALMPRLYVLRNKGFSWNQLTALLVKSGFDLQPSTVRTYYSEMLVSSQDLCQQRVHEQTILSAEVKKINGSGVDVGAVASRLAAITAKRRADAQGLIDAEFGIVGNEIPVTIAPSSLLL